MRQAATSVLGLLLCCLLSGCSSSGGMMRDELRQRRDANAEELQRRLSQESAQGEAGRVKQSGENSALPWVAPLRIPRGEERPDFLDRTASIHQAHQAPLSQVLVQMRSVISKAAGRAVDVQVEADAFDDSAGDGKPVAAASAVPPGGTAANPSSDIAALQAIMLANASQGGAAQREKSVALSFKGTVEDMLESAASTLGLKWRWDTGANRITFYRRVTREWHIAMIPGTASASASLNSEGGSESSVGAGATQTRFNGDMSVWKSLESAVRVAMTPTGKMSVSEPTSMLVVRDTQEAVDRIDAIVRRINDAFRYQVTVDVRIFRVQAGEQDLRGFNWTAAFKSVGLDLDAQSNLTPTSAGGLSSIVLAVNPTAQGELRHWVGSEAIVQSLSHLGEVSSVTNATVKTVNNQPAPVRVGRRISYLKSVSNNAVAQVGSSTTLTPGYIDTGLTLSILPAVQEGGRDLLMQVMLTLAELNGITEFASGGSRAQFPDVSSRDFLQRTWLRSGETLLLFGFESMNEFVKNDGLLHHEWWALGGRSNAGSDKESIVVMMTPVVSSIRQGVY